MDSENSVLFTVLHAGTLHDVGSRLKSDIGPSCTNLHTTDINSHPETVTAVASKFVSYSRKLVGCGPPISHEFQE